MVRAMDKSAALVEAAADGGDPEARFALGLFHLLGRGVDRNLPAALNLLRRAAEAGDEQAELLKGMAAEELAREQIARRDIKKAKRQRNFPKLRVVK